MTFRLSKIVLVPTGGHKTDAGEFDRGRTSGSLAEVDLVDKLMPAIIEQLDMEGIAYYVMPTRVHPGVPAGKRHLWVDPRSLVVHLRFGLGGGKLPANKSRVVYGTGRSKKIATHLTESLGEWGRCFVPGHVTCQPRLSNDDILLRIKETMGVCLEPFCLDGPSAGEYARYTEHLGKAIGSSLAFFMKLRGWGLSRKVAKIV